MTGRKITEAERILAGITLATCECGQPGTEVCYRRGSSEEIWFCGSHKHTARIRELATEGWLSQSANTAASPTGIAIRRHLQSRP